MYINFKYLLCQEFPIPQFILLQQVSQKDFELFELEDLVLLQEKGFVTSKPHKEKVRITKEGKAFLTQCTTYGYTEECGQLVQTLVELYENYNFPIGKELMVRRNLIWFLTITGFKPEIILQTVEGYLNHVVSIGRKAVWLENLVWKFTSVHDNNRRLSESILYELICKKYKLPVTFLTKKRNRGTEYLFQLSQLQPSTKSGIYASGTYEGDKKIKAEAGKLLRKKL